MRINPRSTWAVLDFETTGFNPSEDRIISIAVTALDQNLNIEEQWYTLVKVDRDPGPTYVHGITTEMLEDAPTFMEIKDKLERILKDRILVAHNAAFDSAFLKAEADRLGWSPGHKAVLCTMKLARRVQSDAEDAKLATLARFYGVEQINAHNAEDDTRVLVEVFRKMHKKVIQENIPLYSIDGEARRASVNVKSTYPNPGAWTSGSHLKQGMVIVFTGGDESVRARLEADTAQRGMGVAGSVNKTTSLLVTDGFNGVKARKAAELGVPQVDYESYQSLLFEVDKT